MKTMLADYNAFIEELTEETESGMLKDTDQIQILRAEKSLVQDYKPIRGWYYDAFAMQEELNTPLEEMYLEEEFTKEEWAQMKLDQAAYKKQYEEEKDRLVEISVKAALTEMKQMVKLVKMM